MSGSESFTIGFGDSTRNSSRVLNPPGGISSDIFGTNSLAHGGHKARNVNHLQSSFSLGDTGLGEGVYDVFPEKSARSPQGPAAGAGGGRQARSEVFTERAKAEDDDGVAKEPTEEVKEEDVAGNGLNPQHMHANDKQTQSAGYGVGQGCGEARPGGAHVQRPRVGSRNPITGYGIGEEDTREISSSGGDTHNDNSSSGRTTGKRMYGTYNQRSQQW